MTVSLASVSEKEVCLEFTRADMEPEEFYEAISNVRKDLEKFTAK
jgi:hypothetical protein